MSFGKRSRDSRPLGNRTIPGELSYWPKTRAGAFALVVLAPARATEVTLIVRARSAVEICSHRRKGIVAIVSYAPVPIRLGARCANRGRIPVNVHMATGSFDSSMRARWNKTIFWRGEVISPLAAARKPS